MKHPVYCNIIWSSIYKTYLNTIGRLQNRAIKTIVALGFGQRNCMVAYKQFNFLKFDDLVKMKIVYWHYNNKLPPTFSNYFMRLNQYHSVNTRNQATGCNYVIPLYKTNKLQRSIQYLGEVTWSSIPIEIRYSISYKKYLILNY